MHTKSRNNFKTTEGGYTLIELLLVIALLALAVGVTGDIIVTLVRSYNKTQIANEIEQNANFISLKMEKDLRNAKSITSITANSGNYSLNFVDQDGNAAVYEVKQGRVFRIYNPGATEIPITNNDPISGVNVTCGSTPCFSQVSSNPTVISIDLLFSQAGNPSVVFTGSTELRTTIVVRGSY